MGTFSGMAGAKRGYQTNRLVSGDYIVRIDKCSHFEARQTGEKFKIDLTILAGDGPHRVGESVSVTYSKQHGLDLFLGNIKGFIAGVLNVPDEAIGEAETVQCLDPEQKMAGLVTRIKATERSSKKADEKGQNYSYSQYSWFPCIVDGAEIASTIGPEAVKRFFPTGL